MDELPPRPGSQPALDPLALAFQLKLLWVSGYLPHVSSCSECGSADPLVGYLPQAGGGVCANCAQGSRPVSPAAFAAKSPVSYMGEPKKVSRRTTRVTATRTA